MQDYYGSNYSGNDSGYYDDYLKANEKATRRAYSRYALSLFLFQVITYATVFAAEFILILTLGMDKAVVFFDNIYVQWLFNVVPMYLVAFPAFYLMVKNMKVMKMLTHFMITTVE